MPATKSIETKAAFNFIRYASVWEDADILCEALRPCASGGRLLSVCSSGDNSLSLLTLDPAEVVAADLNPSQLASLELRIAAFKTLEHDALLRFIGVTACAERLATYTSLSGELSDGARRFWDTHPDAVARGIIHAGKFERYLSTFGTRIIPLIHGARKRTKILEAKTAEEQRLFYKEQWNTLLWRGFFRLFFSRFVMGRMGRDPAFFDQVGGSVADRILSRTEYALSEVPTWTNPYLRYILTGNFASEALPHYLRPENFAMIRARLDRLTLLEGPVQNATGSFDGYNLSDIFEYMDTQIHEEVYGSLLKKAKRGARLAYWNMLVSRECPTTMRDLVHSLGDEALELHQRDKAWFYQAFRLEEVR